MQLYRGLPILTNKISVQEQQGIPHHLLDHISLDQETWVVEDFQRAATKTIQDIRSRGNLPIVVGGTHYYTNSLLFEDILVGKGDDNAEPFPILEEPTEVILARLKEVDPVMADRWHPNDRRKIRRSLEIYLQTGQRASEIYADQQIRKTTDSPGNDCMWQSLLFWVWSDRDILKDRLDKRIDKMINMGLMDETRHMYNHAQNKRSCGEEIDMTRGIWQSIGYKEFEPYLKSVIESSTDVEATKTSEQLKAAGLEDMKVATRHYAKYQTRYIKSKLIPLLRQESDSAMDHLFVVDSSDISQWKEAVVAPAVSVTSQFLEGKDLPDPRSLSKTASEVLSEADTTATAQASRIPCRKTCESCGTVSVTEQDWEKHIKSRRHGKARRNAQRRALVEYRGPHTSSSTDIVAEGL
jgi:tRNA dimethylallyltransferase